MKPQYLYSFLALGLLLAMQQGNAHSQVPPGAQTCIRADKDCRLAAVCQPTANQTAEHAAPIPCPPAAPVAR